jgi:hypothetical protein
VFINLAIQAWFNGMKDPRYQDELWGDDPVQRAWRGIHAAAARVATAWDPQAIDYGRARFGLPFTDPRS